MIVWICMPLPAIDTDTSKTTRRKDVSTTAWVGLVRCARLA